MQYALTMMIIACVLFVEYFWRCLWIISHFCIINQTLLSLVLSKWWKNRSRTSVFLATTTTCLLATMFTACKIILVSATSRETSGEITFIEDIMLENTILFINETSGDELSYMHKYFSGQNVCVYIVFSKIFILHDKKSDGSGVPQYRYNEQTVRTDTKKHAGCDLPCI